MASMSFTWTQIARMLGVSHMTVYRRRVEFQMVQSVSGTLSDNELKLLLISMRREHPSMGQTMVWGQLRSMGFNVTRLLGKLLILSVIVITLELTYMREH